MLQDGAGHRLKVGKGAGKSKGERIDRIIALGLSRDASLVLVKGIAVVEQLLWGPPPLRKTPVWSCSNQAES